MKETLIIIIVLLIIFVPNFLFKNYLKDTGKDLLDILESMNDDIANEKDIDKGKSEALKNAFSEKEGKWIMIVDHEILDEIEDGVEECVSYYNENEKTDFNSSFGKLKSHIEDLYKREEISLVNIL